MTPERKQTDAASIDALHDTILDRLNAMRHAMAGTTEDNLGTKVGTALYVADECRRILTLVEAMKAVRL